MTERHKQQSDPDEARRGAGLAPKPAGPEPPGTSTEMGAPEGPETERGGSPAPQSTSRLNEPEGGQ